MYFVSNRTGNMDIYVAEVDLENNTVSNLRNIEWVNTPRDEINPVFNNDETAMYFASNGHIGFGGFDIFATTASEKYGDLIIPMDPVNLKCNLNTNHNELKMVPTENSFLILKEDIYGNRFLYSVTKLPEQSFLDVGIKFKTLNK